MIKSTVIACCVVVAIAATASASTRLKNICRIKGQEENTLRGLGLVVGLNGTGESNDPATMRAVAQAMEVMGNPLTNRGDSYLMSSAQQGGLDELRKIKNVALVIVEATVPATGARRGDQVDCVVSAINGKSLDGGRLAFASLQGPNTQDRRVYALCQGQITIDNPNQPMVGVVHGGCRLEADIFTPFHRDGYITLVLEKNHADFQMADEIVSLIRERVFYTAGNDAANAMDMVRAIDAANIVVKIPEYSRRDPVRFASELLDTPIQEPQTESRVVINTRAGTIVISGDVEIGDVIVSHRNVTVETELPETFAAIDVDDSGRPKLETLVNQLNALRVSTTDMVEIIKGIEKNGKLHGKLIIND